MYLKYYIYAGSCYCLFSKTLYTYFLIFTIFDILWFLLLLLRLECYIDGGYQVPHVFRPSSHRKLFVLLFSFLLKSKCNKCMRLLEFSYLLTIGSFSVCNYFQNRWFQGSFSEFYCITISFPLI